MIKLTGDRVLVRPTPAPVETESGIVLARKYDPPEVTGTVIDLGDGPRAEDGTLLPHYINVGDRVIFAAESGHEMVINRERLFVMREADILAILT